MKWLRKNARCALSRGHVESRARRGGNPWAAEPSAPAGGRRTCRVFPVECRSWKRSSGVCRARVRSALASQICNARLSDLQSEPPSSARSGASEAAACAHRAQPDSERVAWSARISARRCMPAHTPHVVWCITPIGGVIALTGGEIRHGVSASFRKTLCVGMCLCARQIFLRIVSINATTE